MGALSITYSDVAAYRTAALRLQAFKHLTIQPI